MDFQRYNDGVGLIAQNKISAAIPSCPLCGVHNVQWEIAFDFKGNLICILAKCPVCGAIIKTIFDFANNAPITSFTVSQIGTQNVNAMNERASITSIVRNRRNSSTAFRAQPARKRKLRQTAVTTARQVGECWDSSFLSSDLSFGSCGRTIIRSVPARQVSVVSSLFVYRWWQ